ncbi:MAG: glycosyltransferase family 39 protein [Bacteroidales bacterium]|nr:glycosyltransferase family 39 protein [Bacteroidales bacterium]
MYFVFFPFLMGIGFKILGCTLWTARFISVIGGLLALIGLLKIFKELKLSNKLSVMGGLIFIVSNISFVIFRSARPEGLVLTFGIWSIYYLIRYLQEKTLRNLILLSLFSSMAFLVHPNGILFLINSGFVVLYTSLKNKNYFHIGSFIFHPYSL